MSRSSESEEQTQYWLMAELTSTSAELSLNELTVAEILGTVCAQIDEINIQAKAFVDQILIDRKLLREGRDSEFKSFSNALEVLSLKKGLFMELLKDPNSMLVRRVMDMDPSQTGKDKVKSILGGKISECEGVEAADASARTLVMHKRSVKHKSWKNINSQLKSSPETKFAAQPSDEIVILKPVPRSAHHSGIFSCNCSSLQLLHRSNRRVSDEKSTFFSFTKIKEKLKSTFGVAKKVPSQLRCSLDKLSQERSTPECISNGVDMKDSFNWSTDNGKKGKLPKNEDLKSSRVSVIAASVTDSTCRKLDSSSARYSNKQEFDVILEAKMHLSKRLNDLASVEAVTSKKSPRTLDRVLSSPEPDFWPFSPRRDGLYFSGSAEIRVFECSSHVGNELRPNTEVTSCDDHKKLLKTVDAEAGDNSISNADNMNLHGESEIAEVPSKASSASITRPPEKSLQNDGIVMGSVLDSLSENNAVTSKLDRAENIKYQEDHQSPVSVLEPFHAEDANSPPSIITYQTARKQMQRCRLDLEECSAEPSPRNPPVSLDSCTEEHHLCRYVKQVLEASRLNWDQLSEITCPPDELLHESLFHEVEPPPHDCNYDPKLLFDHIHEVLLVIHKLHFCSPWLLASYSSATSTSLVELVLDEILEEEAELLLLPITEKRTFEQLASKDISGSRSWLDVRLDTEHIVVEISEAVVEECLLDTLLQFHT